MNAGIDLATAALGVPIHPTVSELIPTLLLDMKLVEPEPVLPDARCAYPRVESRRGLRRNPVHDLPPVHAYTPTAGGGRSMTMSTPKC